MAKAVETCVHCGFCLPACPTYTELGQETDSPRGRILLMKQVLENDLRPEDVSTHIDQCLGCLACETACPSGVKYRDLISPYRAMAAKKKSFWERLRDKVVSLTLPYPRRFRWALTLGKMARFFQFLTPKVLRPMTDLIPDSLPKPIPLDEIYLAKQKAGCHARAGRGAGVGGRRAQLAQHLLPVAVPTPRHEDERRGERGHGQRGVLVYDL